MWRGLLQGDVGVNASDKDFQLCVTLAAQLQRTSLELLVAGRAARLDEEKLKRFAMENLFRPCPNPQDPTGCESRSSTGGKESALRRSDTAGDGAKARRSDTTGTGSNTTSEYKRHLDAVTVERRKSIQRSTAPGYFVSKHMHGCPSMVYDLGAIVGSGSFGTVRKARHKQTGQIHALKQVEKNNIDAAKLWDEIDVMKQLDHPHIMRLYFTFEDEEHIYMASEMCDGGELYDTIEEAGLLCERSCSALFVQILRAINYLHGAGICHRDCKPENFLVKKNNVEYSAIQLKLIDFGTARRFDKSGMTTKICTPHYVAPEVLKRGDHAYTEKVDIWSCGVILYMMLCGFLPFHHDEQLELLKKVKKGKYAFKPDNVWLYISSEAKSLIQRMMCIKVENRYSALECLNDEWFTKAQEGQQASMDDQIVRQMRKFLTNNRLKRVALQIIARQINDDSIERLRGIFIRIDEDSSGCLTIDEMMEALKELDLSDQSMQEMEHILQCVDQDQSGTIEWTEFLAATLTKEQYLQEDACRAAFHLLDIDEDGVLNTADLRSFLSTQHDVVGTSAIVEIEQIMRETDENNDGDVSYEEFMALLRDEGPRYRDNAVSLRYRYSCRKEKQSIIASGTFPRLGELEELIDEASEDEEEAAFGEAGSLLSLPSEQEKKDSDDTHQGWLMQSQKAWEFQGKSCTLTIYEKKDEQLVEFEVRFMESGEHLTATGSQEDFTQLCKEKEAMGMSRPAATDAAIKELLGGATPEPEQTLTSKSIAPPAGAC